MPSALKNNSVTLRAAGRDPGDKKQGYDSYPSDAASAKERNGDFQDLVDYCIDLYETYSESEYRQSKIEEITESIRVYNQRNTTTVYPWEDASNIVLPLTTITIDNLEPRLVSSLVGREPIVQFDTEGRERPYVELLEEWFNDELNHVVKIKDKVSDLTHKLCLEGTLYALPSYDENEHICRDYVYDAQDQIKLDDEGKPVTQDYIETVFRGGNIDYLEFSDIFVADNVDNWETADVIRVVRPTYAELMRLKDAPSYQNIGPWLLRDAENELSDEDQSPTQSIDSVRVLGKRVIECLECHVSYTYKEPGQSDADVEDWTEERVVALIAKDSGVLIRILRLRDINFKNEHIIKRLRIYPEPGKSYGTCVYGKLKSIQNGASDLFNLIVNVANITMIPWFLYSDKTGFEEARPEIKPGVGIKVDDPSAVVFPRFQTDPNAYLNFVQLFFSLWERISSIGDMQLGRPNNAKQQTATETMAVLQEGNIKHNYQSRVMKSDFLSLIKTVYDLYYQNMPFDTTFHYRGQDVQIPRREMTRAGNFKLTGSTELSNKLIEAQKNEQLYSMLRKDPLANPMELIKDLLESYKEDVVPEKYINPTMALFANALPQNPELAQVVQQYLQQKAMTQQAQGGSKPQQQKQAPQQQAPVNKEQKQQGGIPPQVGALRQ